jgi:hypothetical protein
MCIESVVVYAMCEGCCCTLAACPNLAAVRYNCTRNFLCMVVYYETCCCLLLIALCAADPCQAGTRVPPGDSGPTVHSGTFISYSNTLLPDRVCSPVSGCVDGLTFRTAVVAFVIEPATMKGPSTCRHAEWKAAMIQSSKCVASM